MLLSIARIGQQCRRSASGSGQVGVGDHGVTELRDECPRVTTSPPDKWHCAPVPAVSGHADNAQLWDYSRVSPVSSMSSASGVQSQTRVQSRVQSSVHCQV